MAFSAFRAIVFHLLIRKVMDVKNSEQLDSWKIKQQKENRRVVCDAGDACYFC